MNTIPLFAQKFLVLLSWSLMANHAVAQSYNSLSYAEMFRPPGSVTVDIPPLVYAENALNHPVELDEAKTIPNQYYQNKIKTSAFKLAVKYNASSQTIIKYWQAAYDHQYDIGIPAPVVMAIALNESWFKSRLFQRTGNPFGIKASSAWNGPTYAMKKGNKVIRYRVYASAEEAVLDFSHFIHSRWWYADALACPFDDFRCFIDGLKTELTEPGYADDPNWDKKIFHIIKDNNLDSLFLR